MIEHVKLGARVPAVAGQFGPRLLTYTTQMPLEAIESMLGHDPRSKNWRRLPDDLSHLYNHLQRTTKGDRLDSLAKYMRDRFIERPVILGAFPAISIAVQNPTEFEPIQGHSGIGILNFDLSQRNRRIVVDGLGRVSAALDVVEHAQSNDLPDDERSAIQSLISQVALPVVFFMPAQGQPPLTMDEMQQLFHDFNFRVKPVPERLAIALDHSDPYISLANRIGNSSLIKRLGGMEKKAASLGSKSTAVTTQQWMLRFARAATEGEKFAEDAANAELRQPALTADSFGRFEDAILQYLEAVIAGMGESVFKDRDGLQLTSPGWVTLGTLFHDLHTKLKVPDLASAATRVGRLDWSRTSTLWEGIVRPKMNAAGETILTVQGGGGGQNRRLMVQRVREALGIDKLMFERGLIDAALPVGSEDAKAA